MPAALRLSDVVVNASTEPEGFGRVIIEAQAMARPVIATDHGGAVETIEHGVTGLSRAAGRRAGARGRDRLRARSRCRRNVRRSAQRARAAVKAQFTVRAMQAATIEVYREVLG